MNIDKIIEASNFVLSKCIDVETPEECFFKIEHHLPLKTPWNEGGHINDENNWDLSDEDKARVNECLNLLEDYAEKLIDKYSCHTYPYNFDFSNLEDEILPNWIVFPHYPINTIGWRMGIGEYYATLYQLYRDNLSEEEKIKYDEKYPEPEYFKTRK